MRLLICVILLQAAVGRLAASPPSKPNPNFSCVTALVQVYDADVAEPLLKYAEFAPRLAPLDGHSTDSLPAHENAIRRRTAPIYAAEIRKELSGNADAVCPGGTCDSDAREALVVLQAWNIRGPRHRNFAPLSPQQLQETLSALQPGASRPQFLSSEAWNEYLRTLQKFRSVPLAATSDARSARLEGFIAAELFGYTPKKTCCGSGKCENCPIDLTLSIRTQALRSQQLGQEFAALSLTSAHEVAAATTTFGRKFAASYAEDSDLTQSALVPLATESFLKTSGERFAQSKRLALDPGQLKALIAALRDAAPSALSSSPVEAENAATALFEWALHAQPKGVRGEGALAPIRDAVHSSLAEAPPKERELFNKAWKRALQKNGFLPFALF